MHYCMRHLIMRCLVVLARHTLTFNAGRSPLEASGHMAVTRASTSYAAGATDCSCESTASGVQAGVAAADTTAAAPHAACLAPAVKALVINSERDHVSWMRMQFRHGRRSTTYNSLLFDLLTAGQSPIRHVLILCARACVLHTSTTKQMRRMLYMRAPSSLTAFTVQMQRSK
jgi:hypothetical protein